MQETSGHRFNMFIMKRDKFDAYCEWLFDILFELEKRLDISNYNTNDARVFGFVSERLLDVWINTNNISYTNQPYIFMEKQNWFIKGINFVKKEKYVIKVKYGFNKCYCSGFIMSKNIYIDVLILSLSRLMKILN